MRERFARELRALWIGALLFWIAWASGPLGSTLLFGFVSFFALREFVTLTHTRRADHRALLLAFFVILPAQYVLVGTRLINAFTVFIPVYVFFAIPVISALANDPFRFLERTAKIQWGITVCVYGMSHAPALLLLDLPNYRERGAFLVLFLVLVVVAAQLGQEYASRRLRRRPVARAISRSFSWRAFGAGAGAAGAGRRAALLGDAVQAARRAGDGRDRGRGRNARRVRDEGAQARRRRAQLARRLVGDRRGRPARPRRAALLRGAGVLPLGALVFRHLRPPSARAIGPAFGSNGAMRVLGIDPGLRTTGFGVVECDGGRLRYVASGTIRTAAVALPTCPGASRSSSTACARSPRATRRPAPRSRSSSSTSTRRRRCCSARRAARALSALVSHELAVAEYTALQMKRAIVGHGQAKKEQVQQMVMRLLALPGLPGPDAADALGLAICHAHAAGSFAAIARSATLAPRTSGRYKSGRTY